MYPLSQYRLKSISACVRLYSLARKNHYDVLNLRRNCTDKEIKEAFIQMSKAYHPDRNKDARAQEKFVRIVEAYNVLSKPSSRAQYDSTTEIPTHTDYATYVYRTNVAHNVHNQTYQQYYYDPFESKTKSSKEKPANEWYYGFEGIKKLPNYYIICICLGVAFVGVVLQLYVIRNMYTIQRNKAQERSKYLAEEYDRVRSAARDNTNEMQTRILMEKIVAAANPTVTTATLGQALASEKKSQPDTLLTEFGIGEATEEWYDIDDDIKVNFYDVIREILSYLS